MLAVRICRFDCSKDLSLDGLQLEYKQTMRVSIFLLQFILFLLLHSIDGVLLTNALIESATKVVKDEQNIILGEIRYHFDSSISSCLSVLLVGVGTFMSVSDYDKLSERIVTGKPIVVVAADHNPDNFQKTSPTKYSKLINAIQSQIEDILPFCKHQDLNFILGGHSTYGSCHTAF